jgi:hypothetical protein
MTQGAEEAELKARIQEAIREVADDKELKKIKSLSRHNPMRVAEILYLYSIGKSQTHIVKKYNIQRATVIQVLVDYADHLGQLKDLAGKISAKNYMQLSSLEEDLVEKVRDRMENDPEMEVTFRDLTMNFLIESEVTSASTSLIICLSLWTMKVICSMTTRTIGSARCLLVKPNKIWMQTVSTFGGMTKRTLMI